MLYYYVLELNKMKFPLLLLSNKLFKKLSQKLLAVRKHETNEKRWHKQQSTVYWSVNKYSSEQNN